MARHPRPLDPEGGPVAVFALELRDLRHRMGPTAPTIDQISEKQGIPRSTLYAALSGTRIPTEDVLSTLVRAWGGDPAEWSVRRARVVQAIGLQRLREERLGSVRAISPQALSQDAIDYLELQARREREEQQRRQRTLQLIEEFTGELRRMRREAGITMRELSARTQLSKSFISDILLGRRLPSWPVVEKLLQALIPENDFQAVSGEWMVRWERVRAYTAPPR